VKEIGIQTKSYESIFLLPI